MKCFRFFYFLCVCFINISSTFNLKSHPNRGISLSLQAILKRRKPSGTWTNYPVNTEEIVDGYNFSDGSRIYDVPIITDEPK